MLCDGCGTDFSSDVELYPKLVVTRDERLARKLADKTGDGKEEMLCMSCWMKAIHLCDIETLGMLMLGLLRKNRALENDPLRHQHQTDGIVKKVDVKKWYPQPAPIWHTPTPVTPEFPIKTDVWCSSNTWIQAAGEEDV